MADSRQVEVFVQIGGEEAFSARSQVAAVDSEQARRDLRVTAFAALRARALRLRRRSASGRLG
jgi:hypothetical protein